ncbi:MAG: NYN domain-containing protein, partial [candidate division NC10 bacterium]|nr:NYN domain-containing protein [candidate division NC10 bacterium]
MRIIVDGYNLIRQSPSLSRIEGLDVEAGRRELVRRLSEYQRRKRHQIVVVFDAAKGVHSSPRQERIQGISVAFS